MARHVYLVGFMGSGKTTVGSLLARELDRPFHDLDTLIEREQQASIVEIFESRGEGFFRELESHLLVRSQQLPPCVMALGGGTFVSEFNREFIFRHGVSVWLKAPVQLIKERCRSTAHRPLARDPGQLETLFQVRDRHYRLADIWVEVQFKSARQISAEIQDRLSSDL